MLYNANGSQRDALPQLPGWVDAESPNTWAPDVRQLDNGCFVIYYSASTAVQPGKHCVGVAASCIITGPYIPQDEPLFCPLEQGGAIDAAGFEDQGKRYVVYKVDGNSIGHGGECSNTVAPIIPTPILLQQVSPNGTTPSGPSYTLLNNRGLADGGSVEAPSLIRTSNGKYVLFFSSGCFLTPNYTVNYATANSVMGPYKRAQEPLFRTGDYGLVGPGGMTMYEDARHMVFHARWGPGMNRALFVAEITFWENMAVSLPASNTSTPTTTSSVATPTSFAAGSSIRAPALSMGLLLDRGHGMAMALVIMAIMCSMA